MLLISYEKIEGKGGGEGEEGGKFRRKLCSEGIFFLEAFTQQHYATKQVFFAIASLGIPSALNLELGNNKLDGNKGDMCDFFCNDFSVIDYRNHRKLNH